MAQTDSSLHKTQSVVVSVANMDSEPPILNCQLRPLRSPYEAVISVESTGAIDETKLTTRVPLDEDKLY